MQQPSFLLRVSVCYYPFYVKFQKKAMGYYKFNGDGKYDRINIYKKDSKKS